MSRGAHHDGGLLSNPRPINSFGPRFSTEQGFVTRIAAALVVGLMAAVVHVHLSNDFFWTEGGYGYPLLWAILPLSFVIRGGGRFSRDAQLAARSDPAAGDRAPALQETKTMTIALRPAEARGRANFGWLDSRHTFSFGHYCDPEHMGFGVLRA